MARVTSVYLDEKDDKAVRDYCKDHERQIAWVIRKALKAWPMLQPYYDSPTTEAP